MIYRSSVNHSLKESLQDVYSFKLFCEKKNEEIDYYLSDDMMMEAENSEKKESVFAKIGQAIIDILKKFSELMGKFIDRFRDSSLKNKSNIIKAEKMMKRHPEFKDVILTSIKEGDLDLSDIKSLSELDKAADELTKMALENKIDPKSLRGRWESAKKKFKKAINSDTTKNTLSIVGSTLSIATGIIAIKKFSDSWGSELKNIKNNAEKSTIELKNKIKGSNISKESAAEIKTMMQDQVSLMGNFIFEKFSKIEAANAEIGKKLDALESKIK